MATGDDKLKQMLLLTDCLYFTNGHCMFNNKCRYRHCQIAMKQLEKCPNWPDTCRNVDCPKRHTGTPSKASKPVPSKPVPQEKTLVSFFWNIENAPIPRGQKPFDIVQRIRQKLVLERGLQEVDFSCYCDTNTVSQEHQQSLSHATVRIVHVPDRKPGAVDRQIMLELDRFERTHRPPATIVLISGDIDFFGKLSDLRHQARFRVIVIHNRPANEELKATVNEHYSWELFTEPSQQQQQQLLQPVIRNHSGRSTIQAANVRPVLNNGVNNDYNINGTAPSKSLFDPHSENNLPPKNDIPSTSPAPYRRTNSVIRNPGFTDRAEPPKPLMDLSVNRTPASDTGKNLPPTASLSIVAPRARLRHANSTDQLNRQNIAIPGPCDDDDDDTKKTKRSSLLCPYCTNEFTTIAALRQHQKDKKHLYDCSVCKEGFPTSAGLKQHQMSKGHNVTNDIDDQSNSPFDTADNSNPHQSATHVGHNPNMPNNKKRPPLPRKRKESYSFTNET